MRVATGSTTRLLLRVEAQRAAPSTISPLSTGPLNGWLQPSPVRRRTFWK
jgi:hypothetical protein